MGEACWGLRGVNALCMGYTPFPWHVKQVLAQTAPLSLSFSALPPGPWGWPVQPHRPGGASSSIFPRPPLPSPLNIIFPPSCEP